MALLSTFRLLVFKLSSAERVFLYLFSTDLFPEASGDCSLALG